MSTTEQINEQPADQEKQIQEPRTPEKHDDKNESLKDEEKKEIVGQSPGQKSQLDSPVAQTEQINGSPDRIEENSPI